MHAISEILRTTNFKLGILFLTSIFIQRRVMGSTGFRICCQSESEHEQSRAQITNLQHYSSVSQQNFSFNSFFACKYLGRGIYGSTILIFNKQRKDEKYAQKIIPTNKLVQNYAYMHPKIMNQFKPPLFISLKLMMIENEKLFIVMENMEIGNVGYHIRKNYNVVDQHNIRELCLYSLRILREIHSRGLICRSLRPENIIIANKEGALTFSEPFLCVIGQRLYSYIGCASYTPPEIFQRLQTEGYTKSIDIWMLGVMLYEVLCGVTPFEGENIDQIKKKICEFDPEKLEFRGKQVSQKLKNLIKLILNPNPIERMNIQDINSHSFISEEKVNEQSEISLISLKPAKEDAKQIFTPNRLTYIDFSKSYPRTQEMTKFFNDDT